MFDLEALGISTTNLLISQAICPRPIPDQPLLLNKAYFIFEDIASHGNRIAGMKLFELQKLEQLLAAIPPHESIEVQDPENTQSSTRTEDSTTQIEQTIDGSVLVQGNHMDPFTQPALFGGDFEGRFSTDQISELANGIDLDHAEWISQVLIPSESSY